MHHSEEEWKPVVGFEGFYEVSSHARVRRLANTPNCKTARIISQWTIHNGYYCVSLHSHNKKANRLVHILVAEAFLGKKPAKRDVNHMDGNKTNNRPNNLEYVTRSQNHIHAVRNGLRPSMKLSEKEVREIRSFQGLLSSYKVADMYGVTRPHVCYIWNRKLWAHLAD